MCLRGLLTEVIQTEVVRFVYPMGVVLRKTLAALLCIANIQQNKRNYTETFWKTNEQETKLRIRNITAKAALKFGSEAWVLKKREEQGLETAQMKLLRHLLGITKLDEEKNQCIRGKRSTEYSKGNKKITEKVATTCTEGGHK